MDAGEINDWRILEQIDPWGQRRFDALFANLAANFAAIMGVKKQAGGVFTPKDFLLQFDIDREPPKPQTVEEIERHFRAIAVANNKWWALKAERQKSVTRSK